MYTMYCSLLKTYGDVCTQWLKLDMLILKLVNEFKHEININ